MLSTVIWHRTLHLHTSDELHETEEVLYPPVLCSAVFKGSLETLESMRSEFGANLAASDYDKRTPLHVAASEGNAKVRTVQCACLVKKGRKSNPANGMPSTGSGVPAQERRQRPRSRSQRRHPPQLRHRCRPQGGHLVRVSPPVSCTSIVQSPVNTLARILVECGAHLLMSSQELGESLGFLARKGLVDRIRCYILAGEKGRK